MTDTDQDLARKFAASLQPLAAGVSERLPLRSVASGFIAAGVSISLAQSGRTATAEWLRAVADECETLPDIARC